jgi:hypothetical protein
MPRIPEVWQPIFIFRLTHKNYDNISGLEIVQFPIITKPDKSSVQLEPKHGRKWRQLEAIGTFTPIKFAEKMFPPALNTCVII